MPDFLRRTAVAVTVATAYAVALSVPAAQAASASSPSASHSGLWAGYYSTTAQSTPPLWASVEFTVPKVSCSNSRGSGTYYAGAMWVGIGGQEAKALLEQAGVGVQCKNNKKTTQPAYYPWWEVADTIKQQIWDTSGTKIHAGDQIYAQVSSPGETESPSSGEWEFMVIDDTTDQTWTHSYRIPKGKYTGATVEAITEWPIGSKGTARPGFVDLGQVNYTSADYGTAKNSLLSIPQKKIELWAGKQRLVYPTGAHNTPGSDTPGDAFSTIYDSNWTRAFKK